MTNKFVSWLEHVGRDFKQGLDVALPFAATAGKVAVAIFAPELGPVFNSTVSAIVTAEQSAAAIGQQSGTGAQKLSAVATLMGPLIKQALVDAGKTADDAAVQKYITAVVTILNSLPAPAAVAVAESPAVQAAPSLSGPAPIIKVPVPAGDHNLEVTAMADEGGSPAEVVFPSH
jgi:hypothetical protein